MMNTETRAIAKDLHRLAEDAGALMDATAGMAGDQVEAARQRLSGMLDHARDIYGSMRRKAGTYSDGADGAMHEYPYAVMGVALGVGLLVGYILSRRCARNCCQ